MQQVWYVHMLLWAYRFYSYITLLAYNYVCCVYKWQRFHCYEIVDVCRSIYRMARPYQHNIILCLCVIVAVSITSATQSCYPLSSTNESNSGRRLGSYRQINKPYDDSDVQLILKLAVSQINNVSITDGPRPRYELDIIEGQIQQLEGFKQVIQCMWFYSCFDRTILGIYSFILLFICSL